MANFINTAKRTSYQILKGLNMKRWKVTALLTLICILVGCDNSSKTTSSNSKNIKSDSSSHNNDVDVSQYSVINPVKKNLPIEIDELTTLFDIFAEKNRINYQYRVKNTPTQALLLPSTLETIRNNLLSDYCRDTPEIKTLKNIFPNGANYHYYVDNEEVIIVELKLSDCQAKTK